jgi:hypothetical protein
MKFTLEKFAHILDQTGKGIRDRSDEIADCAQMISNETDIRIFIEHHRSNNQYYQKIKFEPYIEEEVSKLKPIVTSATMSTRDKPKAGLNSKIMIDENYIEKQTLAKSELAPRKH